MRDFTQNSTFFNSTTNETVVTGSVTADTDLRADLAQPRSATLVYLSLDERCDPYYDLYPSVGTDATTGRYSALSEAEHL